MSVFSRGIKNVYRSPARSVVTVLILSLSFGLAAAMLQAVTSLKGQKFMRDFWQNKRDVLTSQSKTEFVASSFGRIINIGQIAFILSLIVGGLITVFVFIITSIERTKEIGILKALGARNIIELADEKYSFRDGKILGS